MPEIYTLYAAYLVQMAATALLAVLLLRFFRAYGHFYLREWAWSWVALCIYVSGGLAAVAWTRMYGPQHPVRLVVVSVTLIAGYAQIAFLLFGTYAVARGRRVTRRRRSLVLAACAVIAIGLALLFTSSPELQNLRFFTRIGIRSLAAGTAYIAAGIWLARDGRWRRGFGRAMVLGAFLLYGVEQLNYFTLNAVEMFEIRQLGDWLALLGFVDVLLQFGMGLGMVMWLLEDERDNLARTADALRRSEERLSRSQRLEAVGRLAGGIAHDFNNLLTVISGRGQRLMSRLPLGGEEWEEVRQIEQAAERGASLVRQLLAFSRKQVLAPRRINANEVVRSVHSMLHRSLGEEIEFDCDLAPDLGWTQVDPTQLEQVLVNLVINARDAMPEGGVLTISTRNVDVSPDTADSLSGPMPGRHIEVVVRDTGIGMDEETRRHIFDPFFSTKEVGKGSGLGLATVYGIVRQSGGAVSVKSARGEGASVRVLLPRVESSETETSPVEAEVAGRSTRGAAVESPHASTLLVVEDDERIRGLLDTVLTDVGYNVIVARSGREALELVGDDGRKIDLLLTDVVMPEVGGPELADRLIERSPGLKVIFMSGYSEEIVSQRLASSARILLEKPFSLPLLLERVRASLEA